jgi:LCP family protein required for cell wall assembly
MLRGIRFRLMGKQNRGRSIVIGLFLAFLFIGSVVASYVYFTISRVVVDENEFVSPQPAVSEFDLSPIPTPEQPTSYNILLLGYGGGEHEGGELTDSMVVVQIDPENKKVTSISVPRDIWITLPEDGGLRVNRKINHAYVLGSGELAKQAVSTVVGLPIQYFVAVSFDGFKEAIDILEGVEVEVPQTFDDYYFPVKGREIDTCGKSPEEVEEILTTLSGFEIDKQFPCRFEHIHFDAGVVHMDGETALKFVRSRHSAEHGGDFARSERQQALLLAIKDKLISLGAVDDAILFFNELSHTFKTDLTKEGIRAIVEVGGDESAYSYSTIMLTEKNVFYLTTSSDGQSILVPKEGAGKWEGIREYIRDQL